MDLSDRKIGARVVALHHISVIFSRLRIYECVYNIYSTYDSRPPLPNISHARGRPVIEYFRVSKIFTKREVKIKGLYLHNIKQYLCANRRHMFLSVFELRSNNFLVQRFFFSSTYLPTLEMYFSYSEHIFFTRDNFF